jgi:hypothetical protein
LVKYTAHALALVVVTTLYLVVLTRGQVLEALFV